MAALLPPGAQHIMQRQTEKYFVASDGQEPVRIYFDRESAYASGVPYLDSFDASGLPVRRYTRDSDGEYLTEY
nr:MAG: hypothetical protein DIU74_03895 [Pseudomonadota bacterium]